LAGASNENEGTAGSAGFGAAPNRGAMLVISLSLPIAGVIDASGKDEDEVVGRATRDALELLVLSTEPNTETVGRFSNPPKTSGLGSVEDGITG